MTYVSLASPRSLWRIASLAGDDCTVGWYRLPIERKIGVKRYGRSVWLFVWARAVLVVVR